MEFLKKIARVSAQHITLLVIPHSNLPLWRARFTLQFLLFCLVVWTGITAWAAFLAGRHVDYWITKADNEVMRAKMVYMASEVSRTREDLQRTLRTDKDLRVLLGMGSRRAIIESEEGVGGPAAPDRLDLLRQLRGSPARIDPSLIRASLQALRRQSQQRLASFQEIAWYVTTKRSLYRSTPLGWPTEGRVSSTFGYRFSPAGSFEEGESSEFHSGLDIANNADTPILATADGAVRHAGWSGGYGRMILIEHRWGYSSLYGHTSKVLVRKGDFVKRGQMIAYMGTTGRSTGNHLHYEIWYQGRPVNPMRFLKPRTAEELHPY